MALSDHESGTPGVAAAIRKQVQVQHEIKDARTLHTSNEEVRKAAEPDRTPRSSAFAAALDQYAALLGSPGSVSLGDIHQRRARLEATQSKYANQDTTSLAEIQDVDDRLSEMGAAGGQTPNPYGHEKLRDHDFTGPSDGPATPVRKRIREIVGFE